ncbi:hypothetical protein DRE_02251 [Drechslerella stenobrocha 248]|uniref:RING-type domain-containing protein n=1 Tax=Drechslerella stenobrocha 248 TaxID=1043628 RepID=W7I7S0_9PEZI|nr:hypothetical protein DRE_02251 [Drechslerella stenobrocha 248]
MIRLQQPGLGVNQSDRSVPAASQPEVIDLTNSPSPPPPPSLAGTRTHHLPRRSRHESARRRDPIVGDAERRHRRLERALQDDLFNRTAPPDWEEEHRRNRQRQRALDQRDWDRQNQELRHRESLWNRQRSPSPRPIGAGPEVIDLDDYPDPEPFLRTSSNRDNHRGFHMRPAARDFELTFAAARVRHPSRDPFNPPENDFNRHHHHHHHHHLAPRTGPSGAPAGAAHAHLPHLPQPDNWFLPPLDPRPNFAGGIGGALDGFLDIVSNFTIPFPRISDLLGGGGAGNRPHAPVAPHRDPQFHPPVLNLDWMRVPGFAQHEEEDIQITGQHHQEDKPIKEARAGFTRSPKSEDAIGCSNCEQELGDSDDDIKKQIWVMKCGHCYCGECANTMLSQPAPRPQKGKRRKFMTCAITGCRQTTSGKRFIWEIYV